ncbi:hypothetical protein [Rhizobium rhizogenes]|uniref:hypothetical protein n=1 Tax=Rhizobium rhizogenes TaxID=359 RepID=UPI0015730012|nr:hypothetical protein [Rhizobium rhizogenes]NTG07198.1 hypothetical protein [Rhizobium rhizogenes]
MTDKIDDGGLAFPGTRQEQVGTVADHGFDDDAPTFDDVHHPGMSLRDWFAGQALAESTRGIWDSHKYDDVAKRAYGIADAMIAARKGGAA